MIFSPTGHRLDQETTHKPHIRYKNIENVASPWWLIKPPIRSAVSTAGSATALRQITEGARHCWKRLSLSQHPETSKQLPWQAQDCSSGPGARRDLARSGEEV